MISKTKEFLLNEINTFKNEIIHFFNIDSINCTLYIYLEIDGKKFKSENSKKNFHKLILRDIGIKNDKKEIDCIIVDNAELKILIRNINKFGRKKSNSLYKKASGEILARGRGYSQPANSLWSKPGSSIKDKIKIFSGEFIKKQIIKAQVIPGKLKIPSLFQKENISHTEKKKEKENEEKNNINGFEINEDNEKK
jgi:hypothetical protein